MITLFRRIRQKLLSENRITKYLLYALGEILLVVFGILIALQVNNWNQQRKRERLELVLLEQLKTDLLGTYEDLHGDAHLLEMAQESDFRILDRMDRDAPYYAQMSFDFFLIRLDEYIYPEESAYTRIKENGLDIVKNDSIRLGTRTIYESLFPRLKKGNGFFPDIDDYWRDYYLEHFKVNPDTTAQLVVQIENDTVSEEVFTYAPLKYPREVRRNGITKIFFTGYAPLDYKKLKSDEQFRMMLQETRLYRDYKLGRYQRAKSYIKEVVRLIDNELAKSR